MLGAECGYLGGQEAYSEGDGRRVQRGEYGTRGGEDGGRPKGCGWRVPEGVHQGNVGCRGLRMKGTQSGSEESLKGCMMGMGISDAWVGKRGVPRG